MWKFSNFVSRPLNQRGDLKWPVPLEGPITKHIGGTRGDGVFFP